jgi:hypothetical protein
MQTEPSIGASHQSSAHLAKQFQRRRLLEISQSETRIFVATMYDLLLLFLIGRSKTKIFSSNSS